MLRSERSGIWRGLWPGCDQHRRQSRISDQHFMKLAKASPEEVDALLNLMRVLRSCEDDGFPCKPDGTHDAPDDANLWFDPDDPDHLRAFYDRIMACFADHPGGLMRTVGGYHLAMTNDVFDPAADTYEWHPTLRAAVEARSKATDELPSNPQELPPNGPTTPSAAPTLRAVALRAISAMGQTKHLFHLPDGHLLCTAERELYDALDAEEQIPTEGCAVEADRLAREAYDEWSHNPSGNSATANLRNRLCAVIQEREDLRAQLAAAQAKLDSALEAIEQQEHQIVNAQAEVERLKARVEELEAVSYEVVKWYDIDGSVGACSNVINDLRQVLLKPVRQDQEEQP
jgi:hypothetical protein